LAEIKGKYAGKSIGLKEIYETVNSINELYAEKGYIVCRAILPPQEIAGGRVRIVLVEGKTGNRTVQGNKSTKISYVLKRIDLVPGEVSNLRELNKSILRFNAVNDAQARIELRAGETFGTTDYLIQLIEPQHHQFSVFADNLGSESSGGYRAGLSYVNTSLLGYRDALSLTGIRTRGATSGGLTYRLPLGRRGTKIGAQFSANTMKIIDGVLREVNVEGKSRSYGLNLSHPFVTGEIWKIEGSLEWTRQDLQTDIMTYEWVKDAITHFGVGVTLMRYGKNTLWYSRHSLTRGGWKQLSGEESAYLKYELLSIWQRNFAKQKLLTVRLRGQYALQEGLPAADQFYIGGAFSVRGYKESALGADSGAALSLEYAIPTGKRGSLLFFADGGFVHGKNAWDDNKLAGVGAGYQLNAGKGGQVSIQYGIPLIKDIGDEKTDSGRFYIQISNRF